MAKSVKLNHQLFNCDSMCAVFFAFSMQFWNIEWQQNVNILRTYAWFAFSVPPRLWMFSDFCVVFTMKIHFFVCFQISPLFWWFENFSRDFFKVNFSGLNGFGFAKFWWRNRLKCRWHKNHKCHTAQRGSSFPKSDSSYSLYIIPSCKHASLF